MWCVPERFRYFQDVRIDLNKALCNVNIKRQFSSTGIWRTFALLTSAHNSYHYKLDIPDSDAFAAWLWHWREAFGASVPVPFPALLLSPFSPSWLPIARVREHRELLQGQLSPSTWPSPHSAAPCPSSPPLHCSQLGSGRDVQELLQQWCGRAPQEHRERTQPPVGTGDCSVHLHTW